MTAHQLAKALLAGPNIPVVINGWGSDKGSTFEVTEISKPGTCSFSAVRDTAKTARDEMGYTKARMCVWLNHCDHTPLSTTEIRRHAATQRRAAMLLKKNPEAYHRIYMKITPLTPEIFESLAKVEKKGAT